MAACSPHTSSIYSLRLSKPAELTCTLSLSHTHMHTVLSAGVQGPSLCKRSHRLADWIKWRQTCGHKHRDTHAQAFIHFSSAGRSPRVGDVLQTCACFQTLVVRVTCSPRVIHAYTLILTNCSILCVSVKRRGCSASLDSEVCNDIFNPFISGCNNNSV